MDKQTQIGIFEREVNRFIEIMTDRFKELTYAEVIGVLQVVIIKLAIKSTKDD